MRKAKGAALPGAVLLGSLLLIVTFSVSYLVVYHATIGRIGSLKSTQRVEFAEAFEKYKARTSVGEIISENLVYTSLSDGDIGALIGRNKGGFMQAYAIYDFSLDALLAYQESDFYIEVRDGHSYLGGILDMEGEA